MKSKRTLMFNFGVVIPNAVYKFGLCATQVAKGYVSISLHCICSLNIHIQDIK